MVNYKRPPLTIAVKCKHEKLGARHTRVEGAICGPVQYANQSETKVFTCTGTIREMFWNESV